MKEEIIKTIEQALDELGEYEVNAIIENYRRKALHDITKPKKKG